MSATMLDRAKVEAAFVVFSTVFDMKLKNTPTIYDRIATVVPGVSERIEFKWLGSIPTFKRWVGDRTFQKLRGETQALTTEWWANGIEVDVDDLNNEARFGMIPIRIRAMAGAAARRMDDQVVSFYVNGFAATLGLTYDGQFLFDTDHTAAGNGLGAAQSNLQTGTLDSTGFNAALQKALLFVDDEGEPIATNMNFVLAGPQQQLKARQLLKQEFQAGGATNIDAGMANWVISPRITGTHWFLLTEDEIKSVILGIEISPQFAALDNPEAYEMFMRRNALYGAHAKFGLCYGPWQAAVGSAG
jgi:phage major head subunit gpT-like protein